jgi:AcrR family transcriptional regulator
VPASIFIRLYEIIVAVPRPALTSRADLIDALIRVVVDRGLDAVSIRTVAAAAGVSIGTVQYHFAGKDELLLAAYERAIEQVTERSQEIVARCAGPAEYVRALLHELLPLDARREAELRVALAFSTRSVNSPRLTALYEEGYRALREAVAEALRQAAPDLEDAERAAVQAIAVADGLAWHLLCAPSRLSPDEATAALDAHLDALLP